jgi:serine/threonine-protein kinase
MTTPADTPAPPLLRAQRLVGEVLSDRYRIESLLGEGGMGAVYLAQHVLMRKRVAIKVLHPEMTGMPEIVARFEREAMAAAHIEHPNVAAATDFGKLQDGACFLVLEYVEGRNLRDVIADGTLPVALALHIAGQIASALGRANALGIVHRDLKPENVMLVERDGDKHFVKVLDFGVAKVPVGEIALRLGEAAPGTALTQLGMVYGTPEYMAPEQALGQEVDARADLYALGVILFEMLTGVRPFEAPSKVTLLGMKVTSDPPSLRSKNPDVRVPESVESLVTKLLQKEASARFQQARDVVEAIDRCRVGEAETEPPLRDASVSRRERRASAPDAQPSSITASDVMPRMRALGRRMAVLIREVPPLGVIGAVGLLLLLLLLIGVAKVRDKPKVSLPAPSSAAAPAEAQEEEKPAEPITVAGADELAAGIRGGGAALEALAARYPADSNVLRALARAYMKEKHVPDAMRTVGKLYSLNEAVGGDDEMKELVRGAAQSAAESAEPAFTLMQSGLGSKGPDWLYDLAVNRATPPRASARAKQALAKPAVRARMSPALTVAWDLRNATGCDAKRALVARAKDRGDARALVQLRPLQATKGCGFLNLSDCWPCLHRDNALAGAIDAIEEREKAP